MPAGYKEARSAWVPAGCCRFPFVCDLVHSCPWLQVDSSHPGATDAVSQRQPEMPLSWEDGIPFPLHDIAGAAGAGNTVLETFISPCFLKLAIIPTIIIVRIYYRDITTVSDPCNSHTRFHPASLVLPSFQSVIIWTPTTFSHMNEGAPSHQPSLERF